MGLAGAVTVPMLALVPALVAAALLPATGAAQEPRGLSYMLGIGYERGGPGPALVSEFLKAGYDDNLPCSVQCEGQNSFPLYHDEGLNITGMAGIRYRFDRPFSLEALVSNGQRGHSQGYSADRGTHLVVSYAAYVMAVTAAAHLGPLRLEAGPVLNGTSWQVTRNSARRRDARTTALGATVGASGGVRVNGMAVSLKVGARRLQAADLRSELLLPLEPEFVTYFIGLTVIPTGE